MQNYSIAVSHHHAPASFLMLPVFVKPMFFPVILLCQKNGNYLIQYTGESEHFRHLLKTLLIFSLMCVQYNALAHEHDCILVYLDQFSPAENCSHLFIFIPLALMQFSGKFR